MRTRHLIFRSVIESMPNGIEPAFQEKCEEKMACYSSTNLYHHFQDLNSGALLSMRNHPLHLILAREIECFFCWFEKKKVHSAIQ